ncbi:hypothetical protein TNCV_398201 [Trichonephila clavipes]|nr:hypothetical protein TNCV_398201 [Trichonephila clavipes]
MIQDYKPSSRRLSFIRPRFSLPLSFLPSFRPLSPLVVRSFSLYRCLVRPVASYTRAFGDVILNHGQVTPELASPSPNYHTDGRTIDRFHAHLSPTRSMTLKTISMPKHGRLKARVGSSGGLLLDSASVTSRSSSSGLRLCVSSSNVAVVPFQQQHVCEIQLLQWFLYLSETPCKLHAEDAKLGTVRVSQQPVEMPDILPDVDAELGTALVSQQLSELHHVPPVQAFAVRLAETFR